MHRKFFFFKLHAVLVNLKSFPSQLFRNLFNMEQTIFSTKTKHLICLSIYRQSSWEILNKNRTLVLFWTHHLIWRSIYNPKEVKKDKKPGDNKDFFLSTSIIIKLYSPNNSSCWQITFKNEIYVYNSLTHNSLREGNLWQDWKLLISDILFMKLFFQFF